MQAYFWGSRGSLPASLTADAVRRKIRRALEMSRGADIESDGALDAFIDTRLPFSVRGSYGGNTSCVEIRGGDEYMICDAGSGLRDFGVWMMSPEILKQDKPRVFHIFLSHLHWDHIQGFPFFTPAYIPGNKIIVYSPHEGAEAVFTRQQAAPCFPVPLSVMAADISFESLEEDREYALGGFKVRTQRQNHPGDSYSYRFEREGGRIVYSTDAEHKEDSDDPGYPFLSFVRNADLLIFDAQYTLAEAIGVKEDWGHSSNMVGVELAVKSGVKRLCLFHNEHTCSDEKFDDFLDKTRSYLKLFDESSDLKIDVAYDGLLISV